MFKVEDVLKICDGTLLKGNLNEKCENFSIDTRTINEDDVYIGIKGETLDGNKFYEEALDKGCKGCILDKDTNIDENVIKDKFIILVDDTLKAMQDLATYKRSMYNIPVIAVTGSAGKTSTKDMIAKVLESKYKVLKTEGSLNNHIGLPLTILRLKDHDVLVIEMGMNHFGEIRTLTNIAKPTIGVITNIGTAHIGRLGSRENILKAKLEILEGLDQEGVLVINNDNDLLHNLKIDHKIVTVGINNNSDYMATDIEEKTFSNSYRVNGETITIPYGGLGFVYNSLLAYAVGKLLKVENIGKCLENINITTGRLEVKTNKNGVTIIDDCYNANLDALENALSVLGKNKNRKIALLGNMLDLDGFEEEMHLKAGYSVFDNKIDVLILVGNLTYKIKEGAISKGFNKDNIYSFNKVEDTYSFLDGFLKSNDIILLKASHPMQFYKIVDHLMGNK